MLPKTRQDLIDFCLRRLGFPVIEINVDDDQLEDRVDEAIQFFRDYHFDSLEHQYVKYNITELDKQREYIVIPDYIISVIEVYSMQPHALSSRNMFSPIYQWFLANAHSLADIELLNYDMVKLKMAELDFFFKTQIPMEFKRHTNRVWMRGIRWQDEFPFSGNTITSIDMASNGYGYTTATVSISTNGSTILATATPTITNGKITGITITNAGQGYDVNNIPTVTISGDGTGASAVATVGTSTIAMEIYRTIDPTEFPDVYSDRWLLLYCYALFKLQWANNLKKYAGISLPGGVTFNGQQMYDEAMNEILAVQQNMIVNFSEPPNFFVG